MKHSLVKRAKKFVHSSFSSFRSSKFRKPVRYDPEHQVYEDTGVFRGFPLGSMGSGGLGVGTDGGFLNLRTNNNWMSPIEHVKGSFWGVSCFHKDRRHSKILRRAYSGGRDYKNIESIKRTSFRGKVPCFSLDFSDEMPVQVSVEGFSPLIPHNQKDSTLPVGFFTVELTNLTDERVPVSFLFSWENVVGDGGTGQTGVKIKGGRPVGLTGWLEYSGVGDYVQEEVELEGLEGISFGTSRQVPEDSHEQSVLGRHLLLLEPQEGVEISRSTCWDARAKRPWLLERFAKTGDIPAEESICSRPAGAINAKCVLGPGERRQLEFMLIWWMPGHVVEENAFERAQTGEHAGVRVGHYYENSFETPESLALYCRSERKRMLQETRELHQLVEGSSLPHWLQNALINSVDSVVCNTVIPKEGTMYTLEGVDWPWYFGGLCGTNDQRLSSSAYTSLFFTEFDKSEVESFRRLHRDGEVPHGNGNCDLGLGDADVPYGWPVQIVGALRDLMWPDLTLSEILQILRLYQITGDRDWLERSWPDLVEMFGALKRMSREGIPEGGSTFDTFSFPGLFMYTALLYVVALDLLCEIAQQRDAVLAHELAGLRRQALARIERELWDEKGGYYRSAEGKDTFFFGALAGEWFSRLSGRDLGLSEERMVSHLKRQHQMLVKGLDGRYGEAAFVFSEVTARGKPVVTRMLETFPIYGYAWQMLSYHAFPAIYAGMVPEGLETIKILFDRIWHRGWPWSADLYGNAGAIYMTHPVVWGVLQALSGASLNVPTRTLSLSPKWLPNTKSTQHLPVCFPNFWGILSISRTSHKAQLHITKQFGEALFIERVVLKDLFGHSSVLRCEPAWELSQGKTFSFLF